MDQRAVVNLIMPYFEREPAVEGVYLAGSLINQHRDVFSDVDLGIATQDGQASLAQVYALYRPVMDAIGPVVHFIERGWDHCKLVAILYGKSQFPPVGLEVDLAFSQMQHVTEQMPYTHYEILLDRTGRLRAALDPITGDRPPGELVQAIRDQLRAYPFLTHDSLKASGRGDLFLFQTLLDAMRQGIFVVAAARRGKTVYGAKRAWLYLTGPEREIVEQSYRAFNRETVQRIAGLFLSCLDDLPPEYGLGPDVERLRAALGEIL
jgi:hypothetical protein